MQNCLKYLRHLLPFVMCKCLFFFFFHICTTAKRLCLYPCILSKVHSYSWVKFALVQVECFKRTVAWNLHENLTEIQGDILGCSEYEQWWVISAANSLHVSLQLCKQYSCRWVFLAITMCAKFVYVLEYFQSHCGKLKLN